MKAFLASHRDKLRGVFFINLESVGAGRLSVVTVEGEQQLLKGDRRIMNLVSKVCKSFHVDCGALEMPYAKTDAYAALEASRRALTIAGVDGTTRRMASRSPNSAALGNARLKTGTLRDVVAIAGYAYGLSGRNYAVVGLINHPNAGAARPAPARASISRRCWRCRPTRQVAQRADQAIKNASVTMAA